MLISVGAPKAYILGTMMPVPLRKLPSDGLHIEGTGAACDWPGNDEKLETGKCRAPNTSRLSLWWRLASNRSVVFIVEYG